MFFANSNIKWTSIKVLLQQWDFPLKITLLWICKKKYGTKQNCKVFPDRGWSLTVLMGLRHLQISAGSVWSTTDVFNSRPLWAHHCSPWRLTLAAYQPESGLQDSVAGLEVCSRCRSSLPQGPLHSRCIRRRPPASAICRYWSSTSSTRSDSHWAAEFRRQWTYHLEQSATSTTFARSVAEHLQAGTEDASLLIRPATLSRFSRLCRCL